jgi:hypothetical protein
LGVGGWRVGVGVEFGNGGWEGVWGLGGSGGRFFEERAEAFPVLKFFQTESEFGNGVEVKFFDLIEGVFKEVLDFGAEVVIEDGCEGSGERKEVIQGFLNGLVKDGPIEGLV